MGSRRIAVRGIIFNEGKLFAVQQKDGQNINSYWNTPGGGLDAGEDLRACLRREMIEETGIKPEIGNLLFIQQFLDDGDPEKEQLEFFFHIKNHEDYRTVDLTKTTHGELEIFDYDFVDPAEKNVLPMFIREIDLQSRVNSCQPVAMFSYLSKVEA